MKQKLSKRFNMKELGKISTYVGIDIVYDLVNNTRTLSQENYIMSLAKNISWNTQGLITHQWKLNLNYIQQT